MREREKRDRQAVRQADGQTDRQADRQSVKQIDIRQVVRK